MGIEDTESLNELFSYVMPIEMEKAFYNDIVGLTQNSIVAYRPLDMEANDYLTDSETLLRGACIYFRKDCLEFELPHSGTDRMDALLRKSQKEEKLIQSIFDLRKKYLMSMSEMERALLRRRE